MGLLTTTALVTLLVAGQPEASQDGSFQPSPIGTWTLDCRRDGNLSGWNYVETCGASNKAGHTKLGFSRSATEAFVVAGVENCPSTEVIVTVPVRNLRIGAPKRVLALRRALETSLLKMSRSCRLQAHDWPVLADSELEQLLIGSDGLKDLRVPEGQ